MKLINADCAQIEQERIVKLLTDTFYPFDYGRWQADELFDEIIALIKGTNE